MLFKEWLVFDQIKTDVFGFAIKQIRLEKALNNANLFIAEALLGESSKAKISDPSPDRTDNWGGESNRAAKIALKNAILKMRWRAVFDRRMQVEQMKAYVEEIQKLRSSGNFSDSSKVPSVLKKVGRMLVKMNYIQNEDLIGDSDSPDSVNKKLSDIEKTLSEASKESDNRLPAELEVHLEPEKMNMITAKAPWRRFRVPPQLEDLIGDNAIAKAKEEFYTILRRILNESFEKYGEKSPKGVRVASVDEIANSFLSRMDEFFTKKRKLKGKKKPSWDFTDGFPMKELNSRMARLASEDEPDDKSVNKLLSWLSGSVRNEMSRFRREAARDLSPSRPKARAKSGQGIRKTDKIVQINKDRNSENFSVYVAYLNALRKGKEEDFEKDWRAEKSPDEIKSFKDAYPGLNETPSEEDEMRLRIIKDIVYLSSTYRAGEFLSKDPNKIKDSLYEYLERILKSSDRDPLHLSTLAGGSDDDDDSGGISDALSSSIESDDDTSGSPDGGMAGSFSNPASIVRSGEESNIILNMLHQALVKLAHMNPEAAVCLCVKFGLDFTPVWDASATTDKRKLVQGLRDVVVKSSAVVGHRPGTTLNLPLGELQPDGSRLPFSGNVLRKNDDGTLKGGNNATDCATQIATIGLSPQEVLDKVIKIPGFEGLEGKLPSVSGYLSRGTEQLCDIMRSMPLPGILSRQAKPTMADDIISKVRSPLSVSISSAPTLPKQGVVDRKFNPDRPSPLASRLRRN